MNTRQLICYGLDNKDVRYNQYFQYSKISILELFNSLNAYIFTYLTHI